MEENQKKGARDISDLKARLGLKKGPGGVPVPGGAAGPGEPSRAGGSIPPPVVPPPVRGAEAAATEAAPAPPPDPRRDPFAAATAQPAGTGYYTPPPSYYAPVPGTDDGQPAAQISQPKPWGRLILAAVIGLALFGFGNACGRIYESRHNFNITTDQAGEIRTEVEKMQKNLNQVSDLLNGSPNAAKNQPDIDLAARLGSLSLAKPDTQKIFHTNYMYLEDIAIEELFTYYNDTILLYGVIADHAKKTEADKDAIKNYVASGGGKGDKNFGVVLDLTGAIPLANFVELGAPVCASGGDANDCSAKDLKGFKYRTSSGGQWFEKPVKGKPQESVIPVQKGELFNSVASGSPDVLAAKDHVRRQAAIRALTSKIANESKDLLGKLKTASERQKVFTF